jgi:hypothetical protein
MVRLPNQLVSTPSVQNRAQLGSVLSCKYKKIYLRFHRINPIFQLASLLEVTF